MVVDPFFEGVWQLEVIDVHGAELLLVGALQVTKVLENQKVSNSCCAHSQLYIMITDWRMDFFVGSFRLEFSFDVSLGRVCSINFVPKGSSYPASTLSAEVVFQMLGGPPEPPEPNMMRMVNQFVASWRKHFETRTSLTDEQKLLHVKFIDAILCASGSPANWLFSEDAWHTNAAVFYANFQSRTAAQWLCLLGFCFPCPVDSRPKRSQIHVVVKCLCALGGLHY